MDLWNIHGLQNVGLIGVTDYASFRRQIGVGYIGRFLAGTGCVETNIMSKS